VGDALTKIREIYARWLGGSLSSEDALFSIGDVFDEEALAGAPGDEESAEAPAAEPARKRDA
jgi:hypothetical protein